MKTNQKTKKRLNLVRIILFGMLFIILIVILWAVGLYLTKDYRHERYLTHINNTLDSYKSGLEAGSSAINARRDKGCDISHFKHADKLFCTQGLSFEVTYKENSYEDFKRVLSVFGRAGQVKLTDDKKNDIAVSDWINRESSGWVRVVGGELNGCAIDSNLDFTELEIVEMNIWVSCSKEFSKPIY